MFEPTLQQAQASHILLWQNWRVNQKILKITNFETNIVKILVKLRLEFEIMCKSLDFQSFSQVAQNILFFNPFKSFLVSRRNYFESGWEWLTPAALNKKSFIKTKITAIQGIASICKHI